MAAGWVVVEIAFVLHGFPGVPRYLFEPAGLTGVLAGVAVGWLLLDAKRYCARCPRWAGIPVAVVLVAVDDPRRDQPRPRRAQGHLPRACPHREINKLGALITALGGPQAWSRPAAGR